MKFAKKTALILLLLSVLYSLVLPMIPIGKKANVGTHQVFITSNAIHTAFLFPKSETAPFNGFFDYQDFKIKENEGIEISFGDIDFFEKSPTWDQFNFQILIDSMLTPDTGLMHVDIYDKKSFTGVPKKELRLTDAQFSSLVTMLKNSFQQKDNRPILYKDLNYYQTDRFYIAAERYFLFNTCNTWTNHILKNINVETALFTPHKWGILWHL